jgi:hypothetical protein
VRRINGEHERSASCVGCWKAYYTPNLSLPDGLNPEREGGV